MYVGWLKSTDILLGQTRSRQEQHRQSHQTLTDRHGWRGFIPGLSANLNYNAYNFMSRSALFVGVDFRESELGVDLVQIQVCVLFFVENWLLRLLLSAGATPASRALPICCTSRVPFLFT